MPDGVAALDPGRSIASHIEDRVQTHPDRIALQTPSGNLTYQEVNNAANRVAHELHDRIGHIGERVIIWLQDPLAETASVLAIWKAGSAFVPLDTKAPLEFNLAIINVVQPHVIIVDREHLALLPDTWRHHPANTICWDDLDPALPSENLDLAIPPETIARIVFTSGSTGKPKGVEHDQRGMLYRAATSIAGADFQAGECQLNLSPLAHVTGSTVLLNTFLIGGTLSCYPLRQWGIERMANWIEQNHVTRFATVSTVFRRFMRSPGLSPDSLLSIRTVYLGAESTRWTDVALFRQFFGPQAKLICNIGSTETGPTARYEVSPEDPIMEGAVPLGIPYPDIELQLLDADGAPVAAGDVGEITIRSRGIACGYFAEPARTAKSFLVDPQDPTVRTFKTGDMGRFDSAQRLFYAGRRDRQIKINGHRIELDYIASVLRQHPAIEEADVRTWLDPLQRPQIAAYFTTSDSEPLQTEALHLWLLDQVPLYMVPTHLQKLDTLPLHSSGKVDRQALPEPPSLTRKSSPSPLSLNPTEQTVLELWRQLLQNPTLGPDDNYFSAGGDSLLAVQLVLEAEQIAGRPLGQHVLFQAPTARKFAHQIDCPSPQLNNLICIQSSGPKIPIFWIHNQIEGAFKALNLASEVEPGRPTFLIECHQQLGLPDPPTSVAALVTLYADLIEQQIPSGPFVLSGYSLGGCFAFAIAAELRHRQREVKTVIVIDRSPVNLPPLINFRMRAPDIVDRIRRQIVGVFRGHRKLDSTYFRSLSSRVLIRLKLKRPTDLPQLDSITLGGPPEDYFTALSFDFKHEPAPIPVFLIHSKKSLFNLPVAWNYLSQGRVTLEWVDEDHLSIPVPPGSKHVSALIQQHLADIQ